jgi:hypothetical protein
MEVKQQMHVYIKAHPKQYGRSFNFQLSNGKVADKNFEWQDGEKEFTYEGKMYDVVDSKTSGGILNIHAYNDQQEEQLHADLANHQRQKQTPVLSQLMSMVFIIQKNEFDLNVLKPSLAHYQNTNSPKPTLIALSIQSPPPDIV